MTSRSKGVAGAVLCAALLWGPGIPAAEPFDMIERIYAETDHDDNPPGGFAMWSREIVALWQDMLERRAATGRAPSILPPGAPGEIEMTMEIETDHEARVRVLYHDAGHPPLEVFFGFVREDGDWKIAEIWRERHDGEMLTLSGLLRALPCGEGPCP